ncbi:MAG: VirB3 family type IV secretion system protein [Hyphomonadaceae bacterium]
MPDAGEIPGFVAPLRQALTQPVLLGGAPRSLAILSGTIALVIVFAGALVAGIVLAIAGHAAGVFLARQDAQAVDALKRCMRIPDRFEP